MVSVVGKVVKYCECKHCDSIVKYSPSEVTVKIKKELPWIYIKRSIKCPLCGNKIKV